MVETETTTASDATVWIDGVGTYRLISHPICTIGCQSSLQQPGRLSMMAPLRTRHAEILRRSGGYIYVPLGSTAPGDTVEPPELLLDDMEIEVTEGIRSRFRMTSCLCETASLEFEPQSIFPERYDAVVLVDQMVVIGPSEDCHIRSKHLEKSRVLIWEGERDCWSLRTLGVDVAGESHDVTIINSGDSITHGELTIRLEV